MSIQEKLAKLKGKTIENVIVDSFCDKGVFDFTLYFTDGSQERFDVEVIFQGNEEFAAEAVIV